MTILHGCIMKLFRRNSERFSDLNSDDCVLSGKSRTLLKEYCIYRNYYWWLLSELWLPILTRPRSVIIYIALIGQILSVAFGIRPAAGDIFHLTYQFFPSDIVAAGSVSAVQININNRLYYTYFIRLPLSSPL